jgi:AcrR family transcriptional regulator
MPEQPSPPREGKRLATRRRIAEASLRLYEAQGYENTTLAAISEAAGISARTLYLHFATKEDTLKYWREEGFVHRLPPIMTQLRPCPEPLATAWAALCALIAEQDPGHSAKVDRLLEGNEALWAHKQATFIAVEEALGRGLALLHPGHAQPALRSVAMIATGTMRLAMVRWREDGATSPILTYMAEEFDLLARVAPKTAAPVTRAANARSARD